MAGLFTRNDAPVTQQAFKSSYSFASDVDADNVVANTFVASCTNLPKGHTVGFLEVMWSPATSAKFQIFQPTNRNTERYMRYSDGGTYTAWSRLDNFGCNTLEELASALKPLLGL